MKRIYAALIILIYSFALSACASIKYNGEGSNAKSLEMSNTTTFGEAIHINGKSQRTFYIVDLVPINGKKLSESIGNCETARDIEIKSERNAIDTLISLVQNAIVGGALFNSLYILFYPELQGAIPFSALVTSRSYEVSGEKRQ